MKDKSKQHPQEKLKAKTNKFAPKPEKQGFIENIDKWTGKHLNKFFWASFILTTLFAVLLFDPRISLGGDDAYYIINAKNILKHNFWPGYEGALYSFFLIPFVAIFGINLYVLKTVSLLCMIGSIWFLFKSFYNRIPNSLLTIVLILFPFNSYVLAYASLTYSEAFYMFVQALMFFIIFKYYIDKMDEQESVAGIFKRIAIVSLCLFVPMLSRNVGLIAVFSFFGFLVLMHKWKDLGAFIVTFSVFYLAFMLFKFVVYGDFSIHVSSHGGELLNKDFYNPAQGKEDIAGLFERFLQNSDKYISKNLYVMLGLRPDNFGIPTISSLTIFSYVIFIIGIVLAFFYNRYLLFTAIYTSGACLVTFVVLQVFWDQSRLLVPFVSLLLIVLLSVVYYLIKEKKYKALIPLYILIPFILFMASLNRMSDHLRQAQKITGKYSGLTPDWENYMKISQWTAENLPEDAVIACRKPTISFIYGNGRSFSGIIRVPSIVTDTVINQWRHNKASYLAIDGEVITKTPVPIQLEKAITGNLAFIVIGKGMYYYLLNVPDTLNEQYTNEFKKNKIIPVNQPDSLLATLKKGNEESYSYSPDTLLKQLADRGVTYVITANLRMNRAQKTGETVNTVERYLYFIQLKYPNLFTKAAQMGADDDEPASLIKINYDSYNLQWMLKKNTQ